MAQVSPYQTAQGKRYRVRYRTPDRRQTDKRGFRTKREAELFAATVRVRCGPDVALISVPEPGHH